MTRHMLHAPEVRHRILSALFLSLLLIKSAQAGEIFNWLQPVSGAFNDPNRWQVGFNVLPPNPDRLIPGGGDRVGLTRGISGFPTAYEISITSGGVAALEATAFALPALTQPLTLRLSGTFTASLVNLERKISLTGGGELKAGRNSYFYDVQVDGGTKLSIEAGLLQLVTLDNARAELGDVELRDQPLPPAPGLVVKNSMLTSRGTVGFGTVVMSDNSVWKHCCDGRTSGGRLEISGNSHFSSMTNVTLTGLKLEGGSSFKADVLDSSGAGGFSVKDASAVRVSSVFLHGGRTELFPDSLDDLSTFDASYFELKQGWLRVSGGSKLRTSTVQMGTAGGATIVITGTGSAWDVLDPALGPSFKIFDGGLVVFDQGAQDMFGRVEGTGSRLAFANAYGKGGLSLAGGGSATGDSLKFAAGNVSVSQPGSSLRVSGVLDLGSDGSAGCEIAEGGSVEGGPAVLASGDNGQTTVNVFGKGSLWRVRGGLEVGKGRTGKGQINILQGGKVQAGSGASKGEMTRIGIGSSVNVSDPVSMFDTQGQAEVRVGVVSGPTGRASLTIASGAYALMNRLVLGPDVVGEGFASVSGAESRIEAQGRIVIGRAGGGAKGILEIRNGARIDAPTVELGNSTSDSTLLITGSGSMLQIEDDVFVAGDRGKGTLTVANGGKLRFTPGETRTFGVGVGDQSVGRLVVDGAQSRVEAQDERLTVGFAGQGTMTVSGGGRIEVKDCVLGFFASGSSGTALVTGQADSVQRSTLRVYEDLDVGGEREPAPAILDVADSGEVTVGETMRIGPRGLARVGATGSITIGGTSHAPPGFLLLESGTLIFENGAQLSFADSERKIINRSGLVIDRRIRKTGLSNPTARDPRGKVALAAPPPAAANPPTVTTINGGLTLEATGVLRVMLSSPADSAPSGALRVTGPVQLGGRLVVDFTDGHAPARGEKIELLRFPAGAAGSFAAIEVTGLAAGFQFEVTLDATGTYTFTALSDALATSPPRLGITRESGNVVISWAETAAGYTLQSSANPGLQPWQSQPATAGNQVRLPASSPAAFFRLMKP